MGLRSIPTQIFSKVKKIKSMNEKVLGTINCTKEPNKDFYLFKEMYGHINKNFKKFYYINLYYILNPKKKINKFIYPKNFIVICPKNYKDLEKFLQKKDLHAFMALGKKFEYLLFFYLLKKYDVKLFINFSIGYYKEKRFFFNKSLIENVINIFRFFIITKISRIIYRLGLILNIAPRYEAIFTGSNSEKKIYKAIIKDGSSYLKLRPKFINNVHKINFRTYDNLKDKIKSQEEKYIVFLDSGFDHGDVIIQQGPHSEENRKKYYSLLQDVLVKFSKLYNKKIIICLHPKTNEKIVRKYIKNLKLIKYQTQNYILKAHTVMFHESSSVLDAIFLKKRIINLQSDVMGEYYRTRNKYYPSKTKMFSLKMENYKEIKKNDINIFFRNKKILYSSFIKNFVDIDINKLLFNPKISQLLKDSNYKPGYEQIINIIKEKYNI